jgi:hypothetical protein
VRKKEAEVVSTGSPLICKRFEDVPKKHWADLMEQRDEMIEMTRLRKARDSDDAEGDDEVDAEEDAADREEAEPLPMQGIEMPAVIQLNGAEGTQLAPPDGDLFGPEDDMDIG